MARESARARSSRAGTLIPEKTIVEPGSLWMGSPGKFRRKLDEKDQARQIMRLSRQRIIWDTKSRT